MRVSPKALAAPTLLPLPALLLAACAAAPPASIAATHPGSPGPAWYGPPAMCLEPAEGYARPASHAPAVSAQHGQYDRIEPVPPHEAGRYEPAPYGRVSFLLGRRELDDPFFDSFGIQSVDNPAAFGVEFSQVPAPGSLGFEFGIQFATDVEENFQGLDTEVTQGEVYAGVRAEFGQSRIRPYIGGGGVLLSSTISQEDFGGRFQNDDTTVGGYVHGGIQLDISDFVFLGLDYRHVFAEDFEFGPFDVDGDYDQVSFVIGMTL